VITEIQEIGHEVAEHMAHANERLGLMDELSLTLVFGLIGGLIALRLRLPPIVGFLLAGIGMSAYTPGHVADVHTAEQLGEIGVAFLMFGVGMHFSIKDLLEVKNIAIPGAIIQSLLATGLTIVLTTLFGWSLGAGIVLGLALSVASTVVLVRALMARDVLNSQAGKIGVGWLVVEDLFSALVLVLLPVLAASLGGIVQERSANETLIESMFNKSDSVLAFTVRQAGVQESIPVLVGITLVNVAVMIGILPVLRRLFSWLLDYIDRSKSDEMLTLTAVVVALFVSFGMNAIFGVSVALGAFFAGIVVSASRLAHAVSEDVRPLRNLFGVLFFASVGMLLDPMTFVRMPLHVLAVVLVIVVAKPAIATGIALMFRQDRGTSLTIGAGLGQIGEFSFILGTLGRSLGLLPDEAYQLIIAGAIISIALNPVVFWVMDRFGHDLGHADNAGTLVQGQSPALEGAAILTADITAAGVAQPEPHGARTAGPSQLPRAS
jgi:CPA2 family monovalent cation:H+ antiporter-2